MSRSSFDLNSHPPPPKPLTRTPPLLPLANAYPSVMIDLVYLIKALDLGRSGRLGGALALLPFVSPWDLASVLFAP